MFEIDSLSYKKINDINNISDEEKWTSWTNAHGFGCIGFIAFLKQ